MSTAGSSKTLSYDKDRKRFTLDNRGASEHSVTDPRIEFSREELRIDCTRISREAFRELQSRWDNFFLKSSIEIVQ